MPYLQSVEVLLPYTESLFNPPTGISWHVLVGILSVPSLRSFRFKGHIWHPDDKIPDDLDFAPTTSLESFRYDIDALLHHLPSRDTTKEQEALSLVLGRLRDSLKQLILPAASAPFDTMMTWNWPSLREFSLRGERVATSLPLIEMLFKTPRLQILSLILAEPADSSPPPIWPPGFAMTGQLPDIEQITVTHPHAEDELYAHLPATLRRLTLRCWPRYYKHRSILNEFMTDAGVDWSSPILTSSEMLHILKRTQKPHLTHLELEYRADADDEKLWRHIGSSYPQLTVLRVHRYRASGEADSNVPVHEITRALSALGRLRLLMICLDFATEPYATTFSDYPTLAQLTRAQREEEIYLDMIANVANTFAAALPRSLEYISVLTPLYKPYLPWRTFRVVRDRTAEKQEIARAETYEVVEDGELLYGYS
ncbi:hypothetical protein BN946_scf184641.g9 [Trametes cinnabarina]|uniref:F-box domain-containing protein n=1 Tax=Pycnoporus cinnabarinus TaxID=5643 RepID=A0A060SQ15_PYCCI|nr:hypothetical protein BN946_scf184641.g9 [Trametes cinnabarina]